MTRRDGALVVASAGVVTLWISLTDAIYRYVRPSMQRWLLLSGAVLLGLGVWMLVSDVLAERRSGHGADDQEHDHDHDDHDHAEHDHRPARVGWLLLVPFVVAFVVDPAALGAYAVDRSSVTRVPTNTEFDLADHIASHSFGGQAVDLTLLQVYVAANDTADAELLADTPVRTEGFIVTTPDGEVVVARLVIGCCAGDALPVSVALRGIDTDGLTDDTWVRIEGTFDPVATAAREAEGQLEMPVLVATGLETIDAPDLPYLYPA